MDWASIRMGQEKIVQTGFRIQLGFTPTSSPGTSGILGCPALWLWHQGEPPGDARCVSPPVAGEVFALKVLPGPCVSWHV